MAKSNDASLIIEQPVPMRKQVYEQLRDRILANTIEPSSRLVETQIAKELGISRTPVREALHLLEKDGFVESIPRVGYQVKHLAWNELNEIFEIRMANERLACQRAIHRIDAKGIKALENNLVEAQKSLERNRPDLFLQYDEEFHDILFHAADSKHLLDLCKTLHRLMQRYRAESMTTQSVIKIAIEGHRRILDSLKSKDEKGLEAALTDHLNESKESIIKYALNKEDVRNMS